MLLKKTNTLNYPILFWNIAKFFQIVFRYLQHLDRLKVLDLAKFAGSDHPFFCIFEKKNNEWIRCSANQMDRRYKPCPFIIILSFQCMLMHQICVMTWYFNCALVGQLQGTGISRYNFHMLKRKLIKVRFFRR